jgi:hypothetical protein
MLMLSMKRPVAGFTLLPFSVTADAVCLRLRLPAGSPYLTGHFPSEAFLPCVAQLVLAVDADGLDSLERDRP